MSSKKKILVALIVSTLMAMTACSKTPLELSEPTKTVPDSMIQDKNAYLEDAAYVPKDTNEVQDTEETEENKDVEETVPTDEKEESTPEATPPPETNPKEEVKSEKTDVVEEVTEPVTTPEPVPTNDATSIQTSTQVVSGIFHYDEAKKTLEMVNNYRQQNGLNALTWNEGLAEASKIRAAEASICWSHQRPNGQEWYTVSGSVKGENLAKGYNTAEGVFQAWLDSPSHRENILWPKFNSVYVSYFEAENGWFWSMEFGY